MLDIRTFNRGQLFGIKISTAECRTGYKAVCLGAYDRAARGFRPVAISTEGVGRGYQIMRFEREEDALDWASQNYQQFTDSLDDMSIMMLGVTKECVRLPVANFTEDAWVDKCKLNFINDRVKREIPEYLDADNPATPERRYRGFSFNQ